MISICGPQRRLIYSYFKFNCDYKHFSLIQSKYRGMKLLSVAEKNDAAKSIAAHLSRGTARKREGFSVYNKIYEFEVNVFGKKCTMIMTSVSGHLLNYEFIGAYKHWQSCNPLSLFEAPVVKNCPEDYQKIKGTLEREVKNCQGLIIWTDCDREGENIGFEIIQVCTEIKPNIQIYRAKFSEITGASVNRALQNLGAPNKNVSDAVDVRQELDLRIGAAFTRFQTLRLQKVFPAQLANNLISYGSCQFPTLGFVVERYRAVEKFVSEKFWKIIVLHKINDLNVEFSWKRNRLFDEQACMVFHDICNENPIATVQNITSKPKSKWRPLPLDTTEMEKLGSRKLRINAKETMKIAEKLYTQGIISYPRTETNIFPKELDLSNLVGLQTNDPEWGFFAKRIMDEGGPTPRQGKKSDQAHPPIHPTKHVTNLTGNDKRVYELIVRSFLACCSKDAQGHETIVDIDIANEKFTASGLMILARNYLDVYPYEKWSGKEIHIYEINQTFQPTSIDLVCGQTSPPSLLTEADLIALMEKHGIGTDATHADHIETIKNRLYVALADNIHFVPGLLGMGLVEGYDDIGLSFSKPDLRAGLEADLKKICEGQKQPQDVLSQQIATYKNVYITVSQEALKLDEALSKRFNENPQHAEIVENIQSMVMKCNKCQADMILRTKKDNQGFFVSCMSYPQCKNALWFPSFVDTVRVTNETCDICSPTSFKLEFKWKNGTCGNLYPSPYKSCISGCNPDFLQMLNINRNNPPSFSQSTLNFSTNELQNRNNLTNPRNNGYSNNSRTNMSSNQNSTFNNTNNNHNSSLGRNSFNGTNNSGTKQQPPISTVSLDTQNNESTVCNCGELAVLLTVKKASPNMGRQFYKCQKPKESGGCNFFLWATSESSEISSNLGQTSWNNTQPSNSGWSGNNTQPSNSGWGGNTTQPSNSGWGGNNTQPNSGWGGNKTQPPNSGRGNNNNDFNGNASNSDYFRAPNNRGSGNVPNCHCNIPSKAITVQKEGPNKGRLFYGCSNPISNRCKFFEWENESSNTNSAPSTSWGSQSTRGRGRGAGSSSRGRSTGERAKKRCGNCREEGHTRNKCPRLE